MTNKSIQCRENICRTIASVVFTVLFLNPIFSKEKGPGEDLSFLRGQHMIKFEFVYDELTISGDPEQVFLQKKAAKMNTKEDGVGDAFVAYWDAQKSFTMPRAFVEEFNSYLKRRAFVGGCSADTASKFDTAKYVCVVKLISIKAGIKNLISPTFWISYTFYENADRSKPLALLKFHVAYAKGGARTSRSGATTYMDTGTWDQAWIGYFKEGRRIGRVIKKAARLRKVPV